MYERQPQAGGDVIDNDFYTSRPTDLQSLNNSDWQISQGEPDIRGWLVTDRQKTSIGIINDLLISPQAQQAVFAVVGRGTAAGAGEGGAPGGGAIGGGGTYGGTFGGATGGAGGTDTGASSAGAGTSPSPPGMPNMVLIPMDRIDLDTNNRQAIFQGDADELVASPAFAENTRDYGDFYEYWAARRPGTQTSGSQAAMAAPSAPAPVEAEHTEARPAGMDQTGQQAPEPVHRETTLTAGQETVIPETEERLDVGKHEEQTGTVEIHKEVEMVPETAHVTIHRTKVNVEEKDVPPRDLQPGERVLREGEVIEIPVVEEELVIEKHPRVTKEIVIRPEIVEEEREVTEQVRKEHVRIETRGDAEVEEQAPGPPPAGS